MENKGPISSASPWKQSDLVFSRARVKATAQTFCSTPKSRPAQHPVGAIHTAALGLVGVERRQASSRLEQVAEREQGPGPLPEDPPKSVRACGGWSSSQPTVPQARPTGNTSLGHPHSTEYVPVAPLVRSLPPVICTRGPSFLPDA